MTPYESGHATGLAGLPADVPVHMHLDGRAARAWCLGHAAGAAERAGWLDVAARGEARDVEYGEPVG